MAFKPIEILINAKDNASSVFSSLQSKVAAVGAAIAGYFGIRAFADVVQGAADLEQGMSRVQAATGASAEEMGRLRQAAEDAGSSTKYTSTEAAGALENLAKAGLSANDSIAALPAVLNLAQAGDIGLGEASEYVTKAVMGMGLAFQDAGRVADVLAMGANASNTSVSGLAQALSYAAPIAQSAGLSLESTVAIMGKLADAGIDASRSGTAVANILAQFSDPASAFKRALADAGITTNNFEQALHQLAEAGPRGEKAIIAVGLNAGPALRSLLNQGMGALDDLKGKLLSAEGSAAATAKTMQDNLHGAMSGLSSAWDSLKIALGTPVLPVLKDGVEQLTAALSGAVKDGTVGRFGEAIATAFKQGIQFVREFVGTIDFRAVVTRLQEFADQANQTLTKVGEYATNAGNTVKLAYGVMAAGANTVLVAIYGIGSVFAEIASTVMTGVAKLREGLATVTFGKLSESFRLAAEDARNVADGFGDAAQAMRDKASQALQDTADAAQTARNGFAGLAGAAQASVPPAAAAAKATDDMGASLEAVRFKALEAEKATRDKAAADAEAAKAIEALRAEYADLVAKGDLQAAAEKQVQINKALEGTPAAAQAAAQGASDAAKQVEAAFERLGITSSAVLAEQAAAAQRDYQIIRESGTASAQDIGSAFKAAAEKAIAANNGIAPSWVQAEAAARGYELQVDRSGKTTLRAAGEAEAAVRGVGDAWHEGSRRIREQEEAMDRLMVKYTMTADLTERQLALLEKEIDLQERRDALERKRRNVDKAGYSLDTEGNRVVAGGDLTTMTGIAAFLKSAGVDDESAARQIARQFADPMGNVPFSNNPGIGRYAPGTGASISEALIKAAEAYTFGIGGGAGASIGADKGGRGTIPEQTRTVRVDLNLNGASYGAVDTTDAGAKTLQNFFSALQQAKAVAA